MNCRETDERAFDYLYNLLEAEERGAFESHVSECAACTAVVERARRQRGMLRAYVPETEGRGLATKVLNASRSRSASRSWRMPAVAAAALFLAVLYAAMEFGTRNPADGLWISGSGSLLQGDRSVAIDGRIPVAGAGTIVTETEQSALVEFADGSRITVGSGSRLRLDPSSRGGSLDAGRIECDVARGLGTFTVSTPLADVQVLGTQFVVKVGGETMDPKVKAAGGGVLVTVAVVAGAVLVRNSQGEVTVEKGQAAVVRPAEAPHGVTEEELGRVNVELQQISLEVAELRVKRTALRREGQELLAAYRSLPAEAKRGGGEKPSRRLDDLMKKQIELQLKTQVKQELDKMDSWVHFQPGQREKMEELLKKLYELIMKVMMEEPEKLMELKGEKEELENDFKARLREILTEEQMAAYQKGKDQEQEEATRKWKEQQERQVQTLVDRLTPTEDQRTTLRSVLTPEAVENLDADYGKMIMGVISREEYRKQKQEKIQSLTEPLRGVLTVEQLAQLQKMLAKDMSQRITEFTPGGEEE